MFLHVSDSPLPGHDAARCRRTDADQHEFMQKRNLDSLFNSRKHVNIAFIYSETKKSNVIIYSVFSERSAALFICDM